MYKQFKIAIILKKISETTYSGLVVSKKYNKKYKITKTSTKKYLLHSNLKNIKEGSIVKIQPISRVSKLKSWEICNVY